MLFEQGQTNVVAGLYTYACMHVCMQLAHCSMLVFSLDPCVCQCNVSKSQLVVAKNEQRQNHSQKGEEKSVVVFSHLFFWERQEATSCLGVI